MSIGTGFGVVRRIGYAILARILYTTLYNFRRILRSRRVYSSILASYLINVNI